MFVCGSLPFIYQDFAVFLVYIISTVPMYCKLHFSKCTKLKHFTAHKIFITLAIKLHNPVYIINFLYHVHSILI